MSLCPNKNDQGKSCAELAELHIYLDFLGVPIAQRGRVLAARERVGLLVHCGARGERARAEARYHNDN
jgi:hypothetical protein